MKLPSLSSSSLFPSWLTNMTLVSLFISIFGVVCFSYYLIGFEEIDMLTLLKASETLPNPFASARVVFNMYNFAFDFFRFIDMKIPQVVIGSDWFSKILEGLLNGIMGVVKILFYIITFIIVFFVSLVFIPISISVWIINTIIAVISTISGNAFATIDLSIIEDLITSWRGVLSV